ncbi:MAG TPA: IS21 family transposase [Acidimicrobiales bacterium]|nr:IS21 family transposase [Acidimicrobiales bacterium]
MTYREVCVYEVREALRLWLRGQGFRSIERMAQLDRKTVRRYVGAAEGLGLVRDGGEEQLTDGFIGAVVEAVRPHRSDGHGAPWRLLAANHDEVKAWLDGGITAVKVQRLLARRGVVVPVRTVQRYAAEACGAGRRPPSTVRLADGAPGDECQVDFGRLGLVPDPATGRRRVCHGLVFTACLSRHCFVWLSFSQTTEAVIEGFEAAWAFFGGVFRTVIPDNLKAVVDQANATEPRFNQAFVEYAQDRGFAIDAARVRRPQDKARVERNVFYVQASFFAGEHFVDLADAQRRAQEWCTLVAGLRIHGTTQARPAEVFAVEERHLLLAAPATPYDLPTYPHPLVARDHHIEVDKALYSVPGNRVGRRVDVRADRCLVRIFERGQLIKVHPRTHVGGRRTDAADLPAEKTPYAMRDLERLKALAAVHGPAVGAYAAALLDTPLPWTRMRQVYALLGLVRRWGAERVDAACARAIDAEAVTGVSLIGRMLERATEREAPTAPPSNPLPAGRFARDAGHFGLAPPLPVDEASAGASA